MIGERLSKRVEPMPSLEFWFEFASTYSYIAAMQIEDRCRDAGVQLVWRPFLLGPIFALQGWNTSHFNLNERRGSYMWRDLERLCAKYSYPWKRPTVFPRATTLPARVACANADQPWLGDYVRRVYIANFGYDREVGEREVVCEILHELGLSAEAVIESAEAPTNRGLLRANTERAIELGIFGSPNYIADAELFWGEEALGDAIDWALHPRDL